MDSDEFRARMRKKFAFTASGTLKRKKGERLVFRRKRQLLELSQLDDIALEDPHANFAAEVVMRAGSSQIIHVTEAGRYHDGVYFSDHSRLYALEYLEDPDESERAFRSLGIDRKRYQRGSPTARLASMPFVKHRLAKSLREFVGGIAIVDADEFERFTAPGATKAVKQAARSRSPHAAALLDSGVYMESKREKKFLYLGVSDRHVWQRKGTLGKHRTFDTTQKFPTAAKALAAATAILDERVSDGFKITTS